MFQCLEVEFLRKENNGEIYEKLFPYLKRFQKGEGLRNFQKLKKPSFNYFIQFFQITRFRGTCKQWGGRTFTLLLPLALPSSFPQNHLFPPLQNSQIHSGYKKFISQCQSFKIGLKIYIR